MLVAAVQWSESAICVHISPLSWISLLPPAPQFHSCRSSESTELSSRVLYSSFPLAIYFGNPLQWSCLENPRDEEAWWAAIYGVAQSQTWLKRLSSNSSSVYMSIPISPFIPPSSSPPCPPHILSLCLHLYSCPTNKFVCTIFPGFSWWLRW